MWYYVFFWINNKYYFERSVLFICFLCRVLSGCTFLSLIITAQRTAILRVVALSRHGSNKFDSALDSRNVIHITPRWGD